MIYQHKYVICFIISKINPTNSAEVYSSTHALGLGTFNEVDTRDKHNVLVKRVRRG